MATKVINTILNMDAGGMLSGLKQVSKATQGLATDLTRAGKKSKGMRFDAALGGLDRFATKASGVYIGAAGAFTAFSVKAGRDMESEFAKVATIADASQKPLKVLKEEILDLSKKSGVAASELSDTVYSAISATGDTANSVGIVEDATKLAKAGFAETGDALSVLTTTMNAYHMEADALTGVSDSLIMTQNLGVTTVGELSTTMGKVIARGSQYGVNLSNIEAGYVALTKSGINTAESTTYLARMMQELGDNGSDIAGVLKDASGQTFAQLMNDGKSLSDVLKIISDSVDGDSTAFTNLWGSAEAGTAAAAIAGQGFGQFNDWLKEIEDSSGLTASAYETMMGTFDSQLSVFKENITNLGIDTWDNYLSEPAKNALQELNNTFQSLDFSALQESLGGAITLGAEKLSWGLQMLAEHGDEVIPVLVEVAKNIIALKAMTKTIMTVRQLGKGFDFVKRHGGTLLGLFTGLNPPVLLVRIAFLALTAGVIYLITHWKQMNAKMQAWKKNHPGIVAAIKAVGAAFDFIITPLKTVVSWAQSAVSWLGQITGVKSGSMNLSSLDTSVDATTGANALGTPYFSGGWTKINERGGEMAYLPGGSMIIPHDRSVRAASAGGGRSININVVVQGNVIGNEEYADELGAYIVRQLEEAEVA